jgi:hypothetical protein
MSARSSVLFLIALSLVMGATRFPGLASNWHLHDASWATFFAGGFYLRAHWRWAFPALMSVAVAIDMAAIRFYGVDNYCVTAAYWFLVPAYAALWSGGNWLRARSSCDGQGLTFLLMSFVCSVSVCFLVSNGSFYWLSGRVANPSWEGWAVNAIAWYWPFTRVALAYVAAAAFIHVIFVKLQVRGSAAVAR